MQFTGNENHRISLEDASTITRNYRNNAGENPFLGGYFGKTAIAAIIGQPDCVGLRIYHGTLDDGSPTFVLCGVTANGEDLTDGELAEIVRPCPPYCSVNSTELISD